MSYAPVVIFAYQRSELLRQTLHSLSQNKEFAESDVFIFCDGPKKDATPAQRHEIEKVRQVAGTLKGCKSLTLFPEAQNKGLANSVIDGVTMITEKYGKVIVVEDDVLLSEHFLFYMNEALEIYKDQEEVQSVGSWNYFADGKIRQETFFLRYPDSIAWATWKRAWSLFIYDEEKLLSGLRKENKMNALNGDGSVPYFEGMLNAQAKGKIDSWAIRWTATSVLLGKMNIYPARTLSKHIGFGVGATHEDSGADYNVHLNLADSPIKLTRFPVAETEEALFFWKEFARKHFIGDGNQKGIKHKLWRLLPASLKQRYQKWKGKKS